MIPLQPDRPNLRHQASLASGRMVPKYEQGTAVSISISTGDHLYWTPDDSQYTKSFDYTYADADFSTAQAVKENYKKRYDWAVRYQGGGARPRDMKSRI